MPQKLRNFLLNFIFPINCFNCKRSGHYLCPVCAQKIERALNNRCPFCGIFSRKGKTCWHCQEEKHLDQLLTFGYFTDPLLQKAIHYLKYSSVYLAARDLGHMMAQAVGANDFFKKAGSANNCLLVPVPMFKSKKRRRGFNQAELLAETVHFSTGVPLAKDLLLKTKDTQPQMKIKNEKQRRENTRDVFGVNFNCDFCGANFCKEGLSRKEIFEKRIILIDDVATTAFTLDSCAKTLKEAGFKEVAGITVARQLRNVRYFFHKP